MREGPFYSTESVAMLYIQNDVYERMSIFRACVFIVQVETSRSR